MNIETLTAFWGWMTLINIALLTLSALGMWLFRGFGMRLHARMYDLKEEDISRVWYQYLGQYKLAIIVFNLAPYLALRVIL